MIRINQYRQPAILRLRVEGTLAGEWVDELERCWLEADSSNGDQLVTVDLAAVTYIDEKGRLLLKRMFRGGVQLSASGVMTRGVVDEITSDSHPP